MTNTVKRPHPVHVSGNERERNTFNASSIDGERRFKAMIVGDCDSFERKHTGTWTTTTPASLHWGEAAVAGDGFKKKKEKKGPMF